MTLDELKFIKFSIDELMKKSKKEITVCNDIKCSSIQCKSLRIINREIRLKELDPVRGNKLDVSGNLIEGD
jgi:hypothetical protein